MKIIDLNRKQSLLEYGIQQLILTAGLKREESLEVMEQVTDDLKHGVEDDRTYPDFSSEGKQ